MNQSTIDLALLALLFLSCMFDLAQRRIPNRLLGVGLLAAMALQFSMSGPAALLSTCLAGFALGLLLFLPLYIAGGMAAGDVKLMATVGAFTGPALAFDIGMATYCAGGVMALCIVIARGRFRHAASNVASMLRPYFMRLRGVPSVPESMPNPSVGNMPYALAISAGSVLMLWIHHT